MHQEERLKAALADRYQVEGEIGSGGMATVYLAEDLKHHRKVALKVLRSELAAILGADRFLVEIQVTAKLQHPNILPLYDSGEADGFLYYVMPLMEGESLRERLDREGQLPVEEVMEIATDVAAALGYAHRHDVIHRDIKPSNILLHEGKALVADFGIALAMRRAGGESRLTETGLSVGTPHYMSPEQAAGDRELDARSDLYALGATTYEMLVGEPPHVGKTPQAVVAKILSDTPTPIRRTRDLVAPNVEAAVAKALARSPADRFSTAAEFAEALADASFTLPTMAAAAEDGEISLGERLWRRSAVVLGILALVATALAAWGWLRSEAPPEVARYNLDFLPGQELLDQGQTVFDVARHAQAIVYTGPGDDGAQLWVKERGDLGARPLAGTEAATMPQFSPDGREVAFVQNMALRKVPVQGGPIVTVANIASLAGAGWMGNDVLVFSVRPDLRLLRISASGDGPVEDLWPDQPADRYAGYPCVLPESRGLLFTLGDGSWASIMDIWVLDLGSREARLLVRDALRSWYLEPGYVVFLRPDGALFALPFDVGSLEPTGDPVALLGGVRIDGLYPNFSLTPDGTVLMLQGAVETAALPNREMVWVSRDGRVEEVDPDWRFVNARNTGWELSPDGTRLAIGINTDEGDDIWVKELDRGPELRLTHDPAEEARPGWTADGDFVYFSTRRQQSEADLFIQRGDGAGDPIPMVVTESGIWQSDLSADGAWVVARTGGVENQTGGRDIVAYRLDQDTTEIPLLRTEYDEISPQISPDGRWLCYASGESGQWEINVRPFPEVESGRWVVSRGGGYGPRWAHNGRELFYISENRELVSATFETEGGFRVTDRQVLFPIPSDFYASRLSFPFDVSPDDERFMMMRILDLGEDAAEPPLVLIEHWAEEVKARMEGR